MLVAGLLLWAGCEDPSNVGLGIIGEEEVEPTRVRLEGSDLPSERAAVITGGLRSGASFAGASRLLMGNADDPLFGRIETTTHVDFSIAIGTGSGYRNGTLNSVDLVFAADDYVYGDTTAVTRVVFHDMDQSWTAFGARSDTTLALGDSALSVPLVLTSSSLIVSMPAEWVEANASTILSENFPDLFHGFGMRSMGDGHIVGFSAADSYMRVATTTGTVDYPMSEILTTLQKDVVPVVDGKSIVQDGFGENAILDFGFSVDSIAGSAISRTVVEVYVDLSVYENPPPNFVRPVPLSLDLVGLRGKRYAAGAQICPHSDRRAGIVCLDGGDGR